MSFSPLVALGVFLATACIDAMYALYTLRVVEKKALQASLFGSGIHILTAFTVISYTQEYRYLIPLVIGSFVGTYGVTRYSVGEDFQKKK